MGGCCAQKQMVDSPLPQCYYPFTLMESPLKHRLLILSHATKLKYTIIMRNQAKETEYHPGAYLRIFFLGSQNVRLKSSNFNYFNLKCTFVYLIASQHRVPTLCWGHSGIRYKRNFDTTLHATRFSFSSSKKLALKILQNKQCSVAIRSCNSQHGRACTQCLVYARHKRNMQLNHEVLHPRCVL